MVHLIERLQQEEWHFIFLFIELLFFKISHLLLVLLAIFKEI